MYEIDRLVCILRPTEYFVEWINSNNSATDEPVTLAMLSDDCTTLLLPPFESVLQANEYLEERYLEIFENELEAWDVNQETWPDNRTFALFNEYFDFEFHSIVIDLAFSDYAIPQYATNTLQ